MLAITAIARLMLHCTPAMPFGSEAALVLPLNDLLSLRCGAGVRYAPRTMAHAATSGPRRLCSPDPLSCSCGSACETYL